MAAASSKTSPPELPCPGGPPREKAGLDEEQVRAEAGDLLRDGGLRPGADGDHDDDRRDADDDAQRRQERPDLIF